MSYDRLAEIMALTDALHSPALVAHINERIAAHTITLIGADSEQVRGRIKALRALLDYPESLQWERDGIAAALSEQSDAA